MSDGLRGRQPATSAKVLIILGNKLLNRRLTKWNDEHISIVRKKPEKREREIVPQTFLMYMHLPTDIQPFVVHCSVFTNNKTSKQTNKHMQAPIQSSFTLTDPSSGYSLFHAPSRPRVFRLPTCPSSVCVSIHPHVPFTLVD